MSEFRKEISENYKNIENINVALNNKINEVNIEVNKALSVITSKFETKYDKKINDLSQAMNNNNNKISNEMILIKNSVNGLTLK